MNRPDPLVAAQVNWAQYEPGQSRGHYESFYLRANHPSEPLAFWLRYTIFAPHGHPEQAEGELWAAVFGAPQPTDKTPGGAAGGASSTASAGEGAAHVTAGGPAGSAATAAGGAGAAAGVAAGVAGGGAAHVTAYQCVSLSECHFDRGAFDVRVGAATLDGTSMRGQAGDIAWDLTYTGDEPPLYLLPARFYKGGFPKAKSLVARPLARFTGELTVAGRSIPVEGWTGSQNHNWGSQHTDKYAFGQVAGFDGEPDSFLELATVRTKVGPVWLPQLTPIVLRHGGQEYSLTSLGTARRATATVSSTSWTFAGESDTAAVRGEITAPADAFVVFEYRNPPGGIKYCRNTKIGSCSLLLTDKRSGRTEELGSAHGALFEILGDSKT